VRTVTKTATKTGIRTEVGSTREIVAKKGVGWTTEPVRRRKRKKEKEKKERKKKKGEEGKRGELE
jgi:hypothetical protein